MSYDGVGGLRLDDHYKNWVFTRLVKLRNATLKWAPYQVNLAFAIC